MKHSSLELVKNIIFIFGVTLSVISTACSLLGDLVNGFNFLLMAIGCFLITLLFSVLKK